MVKVITGGTDEFNALVYGQKNPGTLQFLENQVSQLGQQLSQYSNTLTDAARNFYAAAQAKFDYFNGSEAMRIAAAAVRKVQAIFQPNTIRDLWDIGDIQNAPLVMQRYIMAEPTVREFFAQQRCDGYSDTYIDMHPGSIGENHYDWRRVKHGLLEDDPENDYKVTFYFDDLLEGDRELTLEEKVDIVSVWDRINALMQEGGEDPTSPFGSKL